MCSSDLTDIVGMVQGITKFSIQVTDPKKIRYFLEKATYLARTGRPGPVLLDLPVDVQVAEVNPLELEGFDPAEVDTGISADSDDVLNKKIDEIIALIQNSQRPVLLLGSGVRLGRAE